MSAIGATRTAAKRPFAHALTAGLLALLSLAGEASGQRVQIPTTSPGAFAAPPGPVTGAITPPPVFDPYSGGAALGAPPASVPYTYTPPLAPGTTVVPFDPSPSLGTPVAPGQPFATQPLAPGQTFAAPAQPFGTPQPSQALTPSGFPLSWEPGTYGYEAGDGSTVRFTRFCRELDAEYTHLFGGDGGTDLQLNRIAITSTFTWPVMGNIDSPVLLTPGFVFNFFDDSSFAPFPDDVYEAYLDAAWYPQVNEAFGAELGLRTGVWTDFDEVNSDSVRILGRGLAVFRVAPAAELVAGVVYLDRRRVKLLPAGGIRWKPNPDLEINAVFPNPVVRRRLPSAGTTDWWGFVAGEYGGGSWTHRAQPRGFDYNDLRASAGVGWETASQITGFFEVGFVFDRHFYLAGGAAPEFDETVMLRAGINL